MRGLWKFVGICFVSVPVGVFYRYSQERLSLAWRRWLTQHLIKRYFFNRAYYRIRASEIVDNPDQRIAEDVRLFTTGVLNFFLVIVNSVVTLVAFLGVLWVVSAKLVGVLFLYAAVGTAVSMLFGRRLVGLYFNQYQKEANFRYGLVRVRENAESIAFFRGEKREHRDLIERLTAVLDNTFWIIGWTRNLGFFTNGYNYLALIIPGLIVGPMFMRGEVEFGVVTQAEGAFAAVLAALSIIIAQIEGLSSFTAGIRRLGDLWDNLDEFDAEDAREAEEAKIEVNEEALHLKLDDVTVQTPGGEKTLAQRPQLPAPAPRQPAHHGRKRRGQKLAPPHHRRPVAIRQRRHRPPRAQPPHVPPAKALHGARQPPRAAHVSAQRRRRQRRRHHRRRSRR